MHLAKASPAAVNIPYCLVCSGGLFLELWFSLTVPYFSPVNCFSWQNLQHLFASEQREEIIKSAIDHAGNFIGISLRIRKESLEFEQYLNLRFGKYSNDESITSLAEFVVQKITPRHLVRLSDWTYLVPIQY